MFTRSLSLALALLMLAGGASRADAADAAEVVAAERAFARDGLAMGVKRSFLKWSAPDAIVFDPDPVKAHAVYGAAPDSDPTKPATPLKWWPRWAGVAQSGDLGFTTGAVERGDQRTGHYFTIWKKQADGSWKWIYDGGAQVPSKDEPGPEAEPGYLPVSAAAPIPPEAAMEQVKAAEAALAARARADARAALLKALATDSRVHQPPLPPATTAAARVQALGARPTVIGFKHFGGAASKAGDLAWTYGSADLEQEGSPRAGYYVRVWQRRPEGWRLVFDQLTVKPPSAG
ncbi:MAG TPA: DUF4440 domain-containing protein [Caulobacteraceae bacterium]|jgi:ketosteroid isomerase-like protein